MQLIINLMLITSMPTCEQVKSLYQTAECCGAAQEAAFDVLATQQSVDDLTNRFSILEAVISKLLPKNESNVVVDESRISSLEVSLLGLQNTTTNLEASLLTQIPSTQSPTPDSLVANVQQDLSELVLKIMKNEISAMLGSSTHYLNAQTAMSPITAYNYRTQYVTLFQIFTDNAGNIKTHLNLKGVVFREIWWPPFNETLGDPWSGPYSYVYTPSGINYNGEFYDIYSNHPLAYKSAVTMEYLPEFKEHFRDMDVNILTPALKAAFDATNDGGPILAVTQLIDSMPDVRRTIFPEPHPKLIIDCSAATQGMFQDLGYTGGATGPAIGFNYTISEYTTFVSRAGPSKINFYVYRVWRMHSNNISSWPSLPVPYWWEHFYRPYQSTYAVPDLRMYVVDLEESLPNHLFDRDSGFAPPPPPTCTDLPGLVEHNSALYTCQEAYSGPNALDFFCTTERTFQNTQQQMGPVLSHALVSSKCQAKCGTGTNADILNVVIDDYNYTSCTRVPQVYCNKIGQFNEIRPLTQRCTNCEVTPAQICPFSCQCAGRGDDCITDSRISDAEGLFIVTGSDGSQTPYTCSQYIGTFTTEMCTATLTVSYNEPVYETVRVNAIGSTRCPATCRSC